MNRGEVDYGVGYVVKKLLSLVFSHRLRYKLSGATFQSGRGRVFHTQQADFMVEYHFEALACCPVLGMRLVRLSSVSTVPVHIHVPAPPRPHACLV